MTKLVFKTDWIKKFTAVIISNLNEMRDLAKQRKIELCVQVRLDILQEIGKGFFLIHLIIKKII